MAVRHDDHEFNRMVSQLLKEVEHAHGEVMPFLGVLVTGGLLLVTSTGDKIGRSLLLAAGAAVTLLSRPVALCYPLLATSLRGHTCSRGLLIGECGFPVDWSDG